MLYEVITSIKPLRHAARATSAITILANCFCPVDGEFLLVRKVYKLNAALTAAV